MESIPNPITLAASLAVLGIAPFAAVMVSSFIKIVVVIYILRNALGLQQVPPNLAVNGLAIILTIYVMAPVAYESYNTFKNHNVDINNLQDPNLFAAAKDASSPLSQFLRKHSDETERLFFLNNAKQLWPKELSDKLTEDNFLVLLPSFIISELKSAFEIGFLIYLPFVVIDLIVSNILLAMGMIMVSPIMISLPFKILLFVMADGWSKLLHGLIMSYY